MKWWSLFFGLGFLILSCVQYYLDRELNALQKDGDKAMVAHVISGDLVVVLIPVVVHVAGVEALDPLDADPETQTMGELARDWLASRLPVGSIVTLKGGQTAIARTSSVEDELGDVGSELVQRGLVRETK